MEDDKIPINLKPQQPTFTDDPSLPKEIEIDGKITPTDNKKTSPSLKRRKPDSISTINANAVIFQKLNKIDRLDSISGVESMAILDKLVEELMWLSKQYNEGLLQKHTIQEYIFDAIGGNLGLAESQITPEIFDNMDDGKNVLDIPNILREPFLQMIRNKRENVIEKKAAMMSKSHEELGIPIKKTSKILSNFDANGDLWITEDDITNIAGRYERCLDVESWKEIERKFYLKQAPKLKISSYLDRINTHAGPSCAVGLCAGWYLFKIVFNLKNGNENGELFPKNLYEGEFEMMSINELNVYRIVLTVIRLSLKLIEDKNFKQAYYCKITGLQKLEDLFRLELALGYGLDWELFINEFTLWRYLFQVRSLFKGCENLRKFLSKENRNI